MSEIYVYHVVTEKPMHLGQQIIFKEAENWFEFFVKIGRPTYQIVKLKVNGNCFTGNATKCFDGSISKEKNLKMAEWYWENLMESDEKPPIVEMLVDGEIEVAEIIKECL